MGNNELLCGSDPRRGMTIMESFQLVETFFTFQGEGHFAGSRALFVRMPFCNLACEWCDTDFNKFQKIDKNVFETFIQAEKCRLAVVTGGEPTFHKHTVHVVEMLKKHGYFVCVESNGTGPLEAYKQFDWITVSPKRQTVDKGMDAYHLTPGIEPWVDEYKYVVDDEFDFEILKRHDNSLARLSLSPEWNKKEDNLKRIFEYIERNPQWKISLQSHKILGVR